MIRPDREALAALEHGSDLAASIKEAAASVRLEAFLATLPEDLAYYWHWGDGQGGWLLDRMAAIIIDAGYYWPFGTGISFEGTGQTQTRKARIPRALAKHVMERDADRCVTCGTHTVESLQTMCRPCNSSKGTRL